MLLRAYRPSLALIGLALIVMVALAGLRDSPLAEGLLEVLRWAPVAIAGAALLLLGAATYRLRRWERGEGPACVTCGGPLGGEHEGRANRGGAFRRCYSCGKAVNNRHY
jgi:hypothetical protein